MTVNGHWTSRSYSPQEVMSTKGEVAVVESISQFWLQPQPEQVQSLMATVDELVAKQELGQVLDSVNAGQLCLALYPEDGRWYRAVVDHVGADGPIVNYIDYGNSGIVPADGLRQLPSQLALEPPMALECSLYGSQEASVDICNHFQEIVLNVTLTAVFVEMCGPRYCVRLSDAGGPDLSVELGIDRAGFSSVALGDLILL